MYKLQYFIFSILAMLFLNNALAVELPGPLVDTDWLARNKNDVVILDVRKDVKSFTGKPVYILNKKTGKKKLARVGGHIPGATLVNFKEVRKTRIIDGKKITRMLPEKKDFEALMQKSGVNRDSTIIIVSKGHSSDDVTNATRLYWQLKYYGQDKMAILNGGLAQWILDNHPISLSPSKISKGNWVATAERKEILATTSDVTDAVEHNSAQLIDNRALYLYFGTYKKSYVYAKGHIPGAKTFPYELLTSPTLPAKFLGNEQLQTLSEQLGVKTDKNSITYCNSGHLATGGWFIMSELLGNKNTKLYDGSMHEWTMNNKPVTSMKLE